MYSNTAHGKKLFVMNVYDFDGTIYNGDSTIDFYKYCMKKYPKIILLFPYQVSVFAVYKLGIVSKTKFKEKFYSFFKLLPDIDKLVLAFWDDHICKINKWFFELNEQSDVIITASPEFLVEEAAKRVGVYTVIGSKVDPYTGTTTGENCYGKEKIKRFKEIFGDLIPDRFYTDSFSDMPMICYAKEAYMVRYGQVSLIDKKVIDYHI